MGVHHPYRLDLCADNEDPSQLIIRPEWDAPHVRCLPRTLCAWPCLLRQVGTVLGSPCDCIVTGITYANPGSRHFVLDSPPPAAIVADEEFLLQQLVPDRAVVTARTRVSFCSFCCLPCVNRARIR